MLFKNKLKEPEKEDQEIYLNVFEVAELLRFTPNFIRDMLLKGKLPGKKIGKCWRINKRELLNYMGVK